MKYFFAFDLDGTVTEKEVLPIIAKELGMYRKMDELTRRTMDGEIPFDQSFTQRVDMLKEIPISKVQDIVASVPVSKHIVNFIRENKERCYIVTGNLDVWIVKLVKKIGAINCLSSEAEYKGDQLIGIKNILRKKMIHKIIDNPIVGVGEGYNDMEMLIGSQISITFGGVHTPAPALLDIVDYAIYDDKHLCQFLKLLL